VFGELWVNIDLTSSRMEVLTPNIYCPLRAIKAHGNPNKPKYEYPIPGCIFNLNLEK
jgi:hypothetical protein